MRSLVNDGSAAQAVRAVGDRAGNAYATGGLYNSSTQTVIAIERCAAPCSGFSEIARVAGSATAFTDSALRSRTSYSYRVRASNATGWSPYSASATARTRR